MMHFPGIWRYKFLRAYLIDTLCAACFVQQVILLFLPFSKMRTRDFIGIVIHVCFYVD
jgi:hypothetical protein